MKGLIRFSMITLLALGAGLMACNQAPKENIQVINEGVTANAKLVVDVDGMMCSKGCVKAIESSFAKAEGVKSCDVDFKESMATIEYNDQTTNEAELLALFPSIGGGQYKAVKQAQ